MVSSKEENKTLYWSMSRTYSTKTSQWTAVDPLVAWNPQELVSNPGNWNPYSYCHGDSVNCVDPSGYMGNMDYFSAGTEGQGASSAQEAHYGNLKADSMNPDVIADFKIQDQKLKKAELVAVGLVLVAVNGPIVVAGTIEKVTTLAIGAYMRAQIGLVTVGAYTAKNPQTVTDIVESSMSFVDDVFFEGFGATPAIPMNTYEYLKTSFQAGQKIGNIVSNYVERR